MIRRPPRSTLSSSSAASDVYKRQGIDRGPDGQPAGRAGRVLALLESRSRRRHGHPSTDLPDNVHEWRDDRGRVTAGHWSRMWITLLDNGPLSDVVVRTTPCAGQVGVHRPEHQVELAGVQGGQRHELTLKPPRLDGHERWPPLVVGAGAGVDMGPSPFRDPERGRWGHRSVCLLYTSDAADEEDS